MFRYLLPAPGLLLLLLLSGASPLPFLLHPPLILLPGRLGHVLKAGLQLAGAGAGAGWVQTVSQSVGGYR